MKAYFTSGTYEYLARTVSDFSEEDIFLMRGETSTVAYYENEDKEIFEEARKYEIIVADGTLQKEGFVVLNNIPVTEEGRPIFEHQFKKRSGSMNNVPGFLAMRVLRPDHGNTYVVMVQWENEDKYKEWRNSDSFAASHSKQDKKEKPPYSAGPSYVSKYYMGEEEEEEENE